MNNSIMGKLAVALLFVISFEIGVIIGTKLGTERTAQVCADKIVAERQDCSCK